MMGGVYYTFITVHISDLNQIMREINEHKDKIVSVTQNGDCYTIFYEMRGNEKDGENNG